MAMFNSYVKLPEGMPINIPELDPHLFQTFRMVKSKERDGGTTAQNPVVFGQESRVSLAS